MFVAVAAVSAEFTLSRRGVPLTTQLVAGWIGLLVDLQAMFTILLVVLGVPWEAGLTFERILVANGIAATAIALTVFVRAVRAVRQRGGRGAADGA